MLLAGKLWLTIQRGSILLKKIHKNKAVNRRNNGDTENVLQINYKTY